VLERIDSIRVYIYLCSIIGIAYPFASFYNGITFGYHYYGITLRVFTPEQPQSLAYQYGTPGSVRYNTNLKGGGTLTCVNLPYVGDVRVRSPVKKYGCEAHFCFIGIASHDKKYV